MSNTAEELQKDYKALNEFLINCPELAELETKLGDFNLFQVLGAEYAEFRHSNVLSWLMDPSASHGLDAVFLQKWLMRVLHESGGWSVGVTPVDIDGWLLSEVEVRREWSHIDLLLILKFQGGSQWVICIENKVNAKQYQGQLKGYREKVVAEFPDAQKLLYFFLTKNNEEPEDENYLSTSYTQVHDALADALSLRERSIGSEPQVLIKNYLRLLEEKFMNESDIAEIATKIYRNHRRAIDVILANMPSNSGDLVFAALGERLENQQSQLGIVTGPNDRFFIRFIPKAWDVPGNHQGNGWSPKSGIGVLFEIDFVKKGPRLLIVAGRPPSGWVESIRELCSNPPFQHSLTRNSGIYPSIYAEWIDAYDTNEIFSPEEGADIIFDWIRNRLAADDMKEVIRLLTPQIERITEFLDQASN